MNHAEASDQWVSWTGSILTHLLAVVVLFMGLGFFQNKEPLKLGVVVDVALIDLTQAQSLLAPKVQAREAVKPKPEPKPETRSERVPEPRPVAETTVQRAIETTRVDEAALETERRREEDRLKREAETRRQRELDAKQRAEAEKLERELREQLIAQELEAARVNDILEDENSTGYNPPVGEATDSLLTEYALAIQIAVTRAWIRPPHTQAGLACRLVIRQMVPGEVIDAWVDDRNCNTDDPVIRRSLEAAVRRASPLPYDGYEAVFQGEIGLIYQY